MSPIRKEVTIGDCSGVRIRFVGDERTAVIYAIAPFDGGKSRPVPEHVRERGIVAAAKRRKELTHCLRGHPLSGDNLRVNKTGSRVCRTCERLHKRPLSGVAS